MTEKLQLALLGNLEIRRDGVLVTGLRSGKAQALLCYLAVTGRPHLRPSLTGLLWGDMPGDRARSNLSKSLTYLRQAVGRYLSITRQAVSFDRQSPYWLDVEAFEEGVSARADVEQMRNAVGLYRGEFMEGFYVRQAPAFEEWVLAQRARMRELALQALHTLVVHHIRRGAAGRAAGIEVATRLLALEPWREEAHRQLMTLLAYSGQRGAALAQYEACCQVLAQELGVQPGAETTALYERIRDGELGQDAGVLQMHAGRAVGPLAPPPFLSAGPPPSGSPAHFVARERELAQLDGYLAEALAGQGRIVFITGEAGTGKTALVGEFARRAQVRHADLVVAYGNCNAYTGAGDPYLPFREILGQLTGDVEARWAAGALSTEGAHRLWRLMPLAIQSLLEEGPGLIDTLLAGPALAVRAATAAPGSADWRARLERSLTSDGTGRGQASLRSVDLYAQVTALLSALARKHLLLLAVDDLQWADAGSIDLLFHIGRRLAGIRILVVGIYRPSEVSMGREGKRHPLAPVIHEFQRQFGKIEVGLPQVEGRQFVEALLDSEPNRLDAAFRQALHTQTRGHALYTVEMLREMQERGDLVQDEAGRWVEGPAVDWHSLPLRVEGAIGERLDHLSAALRETLKVASVEGETFTAEVVARVLGTSAVEIVSQLSNELGRRHRLVVSEGSGPVRPSGQRASRYRFRHILFQAYAYDGLDEAERAYLHEAVGNALEYLYAGQTDAVAVQLAQHFWAAYQMDKAAGYALQAGDRARGLYAYAEARQHYARALDALAQLVDTERNRRRRVDALIARTICSTGTDPWERNLDRLTEAERLAQALPGPDGRTGGDRLRLARVHLWMGRNHYTRGAYRGCIAYYQRALSAARELGDTELIGLSSSALGHAFASRGHLGEAEALLRQAMDLLDRAGDRVERARVRMLHGAVLAHLGDYAEGVDELQRTHAQLREVNALTEISFNRFLLSAVCRVGGDLPHAIETARQGLAVAKESGRQVSIYDGYLTLGWAMCLTGQYDAAATHAEKAHAIMQELGGCLIMADQLAALDAEIACGAGRVREAITLAERAVGIAQERKTIHYEGLARRAWGQALVALKTPQWDEAEAQLAHSLRLFEEGQARLEAARTHEAWGALCRERGDLAGARAHWEQAAAQWETSGLSHELERTRTLIEGLASE